MNFVVEAHCIRAIRDYINIIIYGFYVAVFVPGRYSLGKCVVLHLVRFNCFGLGCSAMSSK